MTSRTLRRSFARSAVSVAAFGTLAGGAASAGAATATGTYNREDFFRVDSPSGDVTCRIWGSLTTYDDGTVTVGVTSADAEGSSRVCAEGAINIDITYDPDPSDEATSTIRIRGGGSELTAYGVPAPNFIVSRHSIHWQYQPEDPVQTAGPYQLPKSK